MSSPAITIAADRTVLEAADLTRRHQINQLPVLHQPALRLTGILTRCDLVTIYTRPDADLDEEIRAVLTTRFPEVDPSELRITLRYGSVKGHGLVSHRSTIKKIVTAIAEIEGGRTRRSRLDRPPMPQAR